MNCDTGPRSFEQLINLKRLLHGESRRTGSPETNGTVRVTSRPKPGSSNVHRASGKSRTKSDRAGDKGHARESTLVREIQWL